MNNQIEIQVSIVPLKAENQQKFSESELNLLQKYFPELLKETIEIVNNEKE